MHETEKQKINLVYNHNFQEKFDFYMQDNRNQNYTKSFKGELQAKMQDSILLSGKAYLNPIYSTLLSKKGLKAK